MSLKVEFPEEIRVADVIKFAMQHGLRLSYIRHGEHRAVPIEPKKKGAESVR